jgi:hypothetical protein
MMTQKSRLVGLDVAKPPEAGARSASLEPGRAPGYRQTSQLLILPFSGRRLRDSHNVEQSRNNAPFGANPHRAPCLYAAIAECFRDAR